MDEFITPLDEPVVVDTSPFDVEVEQFIKLRDALKAADDAHQEKTKPARQYLEDMKGKMLARLLLIGGDSVATKAGTVYRTSRKSATITDGHTFRQYVINNDLWDIVDWKANAPAVADFIETHNAAPPGVNYQIAYTVGVRRS